MILRQGEEFIALRDVCPHQGARLSAGQLGGTPLPCRPGEEIEYGRVGQVLTCPWHGWEFDVTTGAMPVNPRIGLKTFPVVVEGDDVKIELEAARG